MYKYIKECNVCFIENIMFINQEMVSTTQPEGHSADHAEPGPDPVPIHLGVQLI